MGSTTHLKTIKFITLMTSTSNLKPI